MDPTAQLCDFKARAPSADACLAAELAAALASLAPGVDLEVWRLACEAAGLSAQPAAVAELLVSVGLAVRDAQGLRFVCEAAREVVCAAEADAERRASHHRICAQALFLAYPRPTPGVAACRAEHLLRGGRAAEALEPLLVAEDEAYMAGRLDAAAELLDRRQGVLETLDPSEHVRDRAQNACRRARVRYARGRPQEALALVERCLSLIEEAGWAAERGEAALLRGRILRDAGQLDAARASLEIAIAAFAEAGDERGLAMSQASRAYVHLLHGEHARARQRFERAREALEAMGDTANAASTLVYIAQTWLHDGERDRGRRCAERALALARQANHLPNEAAALNFLGEVARQAGDWSEARRHYQRAAARYETAGIRVVHIARYNLALSAIGMGDFAAAEALLADVEAAYVEVGFEARLGLVFAGLMTCAAGQRDWASCSLYAERAAANLQRAGLSHDDVVWLARRCAEIAEHAGRDEARQLALALVELDGRRAE